MERKSNFGPDDESEKESSSGEPAEKARPVTPTESGTFFSRKPEGSKSFEEFFRPPPAVFEQKPKDDEDEESGSGEESEDEFQGEQHQETEGDPSSQKKPEGQESLADVLSEPFQESPEPYVAPDQNASHSSPHSPISPALAESLPSEPLEQLPQPPSPAHPSLGKLGGPVPSMPAEAPPTSAAHEATLTPPPASGSTPPPRPPIERSAQMGGFSERPESQPLFANTNNTTFTPRQTESASRPTESLYTPQDVQRAERVGLGRGLVAGAITAWVIKSHIERNKHKRNQAETDKRIKEHRERIERLQLDQTEQAQRFNTAQQRYEADKVQATPVFAPDESFRSGAAGPLKNEQSLPPVEQTKPGVPAAEQLFNTPGEQVRNPEPEERVVHSTWHDIHVDKFGHELQGANRYGEAFQQERARERMPTPFGAADMRFKGGAAGQQPGQDWQAPGGPGTALHTAADHMLAPSRTQIDLQHRLPPAKNPIIAALGSPWLWLAVGILIAAFFLASSL